MKAGQLFGTTTPGRPTAPAGFMEVLSVGQEAGATAEVKDDADPFARVPSDPLPWADNGGKWPSDAQLAEIKELAPPMPAPTEEEVNAMARYFGQESATAPSAGGPRGGFRVHPGRQGLHHQCGRGGPCGHRGGG
jgi:hypothetical protein